MQYELNLELHHSAIERLTARVKQLEQTLADLVERTSRAELQKDSSALVGAINEAIAKVDAFTKPPQW
ncbi:hypothetical protein [uncultured Sphingomonas sp.]|uniref:hypothetical protein n=1 Tax=uncultured Sphingomonas sp. TaxID=158754 RepID=UPI00262D3736|nr:hypothetical protein [uncultured Sphingomonas sp.]